MWKEGVLENNLILPVLKRVRVSPHMGPSIDVEAEREAKNEEQGGGRRVRCERNVEEGGHEGI